MNYYDARQLLKDGKPTGWHYTCLNDGRTWPVGYCADHEPHETEEEARECYRRYLLENRLRLDAEFSHAEKCLVCGEWTPKAAVLDMQHFFLCDEHRTREEVESRVEAPGQIISSY